MQETSAPTLTVDPTSNNSLSTQPPNNPLDSEFRYVLFSVVYSIYFILGSSANIYILYILRSLRQSMGEIRIYMTNLTIADLLFVSALPFWIHYYYHEGDWMFEEFMCQLTGSFFFINTYGTVLFLGAISLNRYWAVTKPLDAASSDNRRRGIIVCVAIWLLTVLTTIPHWSTKATHTQSKTNQTQENVTRCYEGYQSEKNEDKRTVAILNFLIIGMFFVVFSLVVVCNVLMARALLKQKFPQSEMRSETLTSKKSATPSTARRRSRGVKRRALQMLFAVVGVFVLCFLPHHIVQGPWTLAVLQITDGNWGYVGWTEKTRQALNDAHQITLVLMGLNCILDPIVYYFATRKFRKVLVAHFKKFTKGEGCSSTIARHLSITSSGQCQKLQSIHRNSNQK